ncbi:phage tail tape measure protein [Rosenbergiella epipactidis]|uniref:phage tail tape measure protein n=1 Tax=Rosenbergiella epipactidis TaxID=1544694 RepID=UPI001F4EA981|nr:phage tail tape measure protein [Rosenbergiella epipactidis]
MAEQTSRLAVIIDSSGAQKNTETLASSLAKLTQAGQKAADGAGKVTKATQEESEALHQLLARIDPVNAALNKLDQQQQQLAKFKSKGFIDEDGFDLYSKKIDAARDHLTGMSDQLLKTGQSAKQAAWAMRMIPAQMTDIVVGLSSGQSPFTVLMQQGGQLKDMFGGIGPAIRGVGGYVMGLINPFTLGAAAVGALGLAYYQGQQEQEVFQQSLILTGNQVGKTAGQLSDMARNVSLATGSTQGAAADVLNQLVSAGNIAGDSLQKVAGSIANMSNVTGQATTQMVSDFESIAENPVQAISKLNDQYHFLTLATYNQIKALADEGNQQEAARVASDAYANTLNSRANDIAKSLGYMERAWNSVGGAAKSAWDYMLNIGRDNTQDQIAKVQEKIEALSKPGLGSRFISADHSNQLNALKSQLIMLQSQAATETVLNESISKHDQAQQQSIKTQQEADRVNQQYLTNAEKRNQAIKQQSDFLKAGAISAQQYAHNIAQINQMYKDPAQPKERQGRAYSEDAGSRLIDQLKQQHAVLTAQVDASDKLGSAQQDLVKWQTKLDELNKKKNLTNDEKSLLLHQKELSLLYQSNAASEKQQQLVKQTAALSGYQSNLNRDISSRNSQYSNDESVASGARSAYQQGILTQRITLEQQLNDKVIQLRQQRTSATTEIDRQTIDQEIAMQQSANDQILTRYDSHIKSMEASRVSFTAGAKVAWQEYADSASNASGMTQTLFSDAFSSMEDAIVSFSTSGKLSFNGFANSVISDIARIAARMAISGLASSVIGGVSGLFGSPSTAVAGNAGTALSNAASNIKLNAKGGVYDSPSLSSYSNQVYTSPKLFAFAKGAGVFGEAGPEAIMPLTRGKNGSLGVRAIGAQSSTGGDINLGGIVVNVDSSGKASSGSATDGQGIGKQIQQAVINTLNDQANRQGTPLWRAINKR